METNLDARRVIAKIGFGALVWLGTAVSLAIIEAFLGPAWGRIPFLGVLCGSGYLIYRLVREDDPEEFLGYVEVLIYGHITVFTSLLVISGVLG
jgi:hypothetical protein